MRAAFKTLAILAIVLGVFLLLLGLVFTVSSLPAYLEMLRGTTAIALAGGDAELAQAFGYAAAGIMLIIPGLLVFAAGLLGVVNAYEKAAFVGGVIVFALFFDVLLSDYADAFVLLGMALCAAFIGLARYLEAKRVAAG